MTGRPLKFATPEEMQKQIDAYFKDCQENDIPLTITGLALALDTDRQTLINYEKRDAYFDTVKRAKMKIENAYELRLIKSGRAGDIFALKNFGWTDKQDLALSDMRSIEIIDDLDES